MTTMGYAYVMDPRGRAARRYISLVQQLAAEHEERHGWQSAVGRMLGVSQGYISKLWAGTRDSVGPSAIDRAIEKMGLDPVFFYGDGPDELPYKRFLPKSIGPVGEDPPGFWKWLDGEEAAHATKAELEALRGMGRSADAAGLSPRPATFSAWLVSLRMLGNPTTTKPSE